MLSDIVLQSHDCACDLEHLKLGFSMMSFIQLVQDDEGNTALIQACQGGHVKTARVLLDHGANVNYQNKV